MYRAFFAVSLILGGMALGLCALLNPRRVTDELIRLCAELEKRRSWTAEAEEPRDVTPKRRSAFTASFGLFNR